MPERKESGFPNTRRGGFGLALAIVVVLVGAVLSAALINMGYSFMSSTRRQRNFYGDHVSVTDYAQAARGTLTADNIARVRAAGAVWHGKNLTTSSDITSLNDLMLDSAKYNYEEDVGSWGLGSQKIAVNVYDVHYTFGQVKAPLLSDPAQMRALPSPINAIPGEGRATGGGSGGDGDTMVGDGETTAVDQGSKDGVTGGGGYPWERFGAYVVRVSLFNVDSSGHRTLARSAEEAFYQLVSPDY